jgi:transposase
MSKQSSQEAERLVRKRVGELPILHATARRIGLRQSLSHYLPSHGNESFPAIDTLMLLGYNLAAGRQPLYELSEWVAKLDSRPLGYPSLGGVFFNDDRFGRALDKLYLADRASLMTEIVLNTIRATGLSMAELHNDSTTLKAFGKIPGKTITGFFLARGHSKEHRPDLKQLVYTLTVSADGAVPVHYKTYPGNRTDDTTHIETWNTLCFVAGRKDFLYVADCKVCTEKQLAYITKRGGRVVTIMPETWKEVRQFKDALRQNAKAKTTIWRRPVPNYPERTETFACFQGTHRTEKKNYSIFWIFSSEKRKRDRVSREATLRKVETALTNLMGKLNRRNLKTETQIRTRVNQILDEHHATALYHVDILTIGETHTSQVGRGRPGQHTRYITRHQTVYSLAWTRNAMAIKAEMRVDGIFPLLCTDSALTAKDALMAYKFQPRLEKRFNLLRSVLLAAPLLFKKIERVEAIMFVFFVALILQAVIERQVRKSMKAFEIDALPLYPEHRLAHHPTTAKIIDRFEDVSTHLLISDVHPVKEYNDPLTPLHKEILALLNIPEAEYWSLCS